MNKNCFGKIRYFLLVMVLPLSVAVVNAQSFYNTTSWKFSNPKPFGITILDVDYFDNNNVLAVGSDGGICKSTDGGNTWVYGVFSYYTSANTLTKCTFNDVHFVTSTIAYAAGSPGCLAKSTDGGTTWTLIKTPLFDKGRNINTVWFVNKDTGYIGGQHNTPDSLPKVYFTRNGGTTWDSLSAPTGGKSRIGYVNNVNLAPVIVDVTAKDKEIQRIEFLNENIGYIVGSGLSTFERHPAALANCSVSGTTTSGSHHASLVWKFANGTLTDYSTSKERLGYSGVPTGTITCTSRYASLQACTQTYKAINILNDSTLLMMSFNNNIVLKIHTGKNDSTQNVAVPGLYEKGKYDILNYPFPPNNIPIPNPQVLLASNPYQIKRAASGKLYAAANFGLLWTSVDNGANWVRELSLPQGKNYSGFATWALDIAPNGKFLSMGQAGVFADSIPGRAGGWQSPYITTPAGGSFTKFEFADCNNGIAAGGANINVTTDGGATWIDKTRQDFINSNYTINGMAYPNLNKVYIAVNSGILYSSPDKGTTLDPIYSNFNFQMQDVAAQGNDSIWLVASSAFSIPAASRTSNIFRSFNGGATWATVSAPFAVGSTFQTLTDIEFPTRLVGYASGNKDTIWKTTDAGATWTKLPLPFPGVTPQISYTDMFALDANTVFLCGNGFPRKVVIKTTDGGATWQDITGNITTIYPVGNMNGVLFHDANNGYVCGPGGALLKTNNGGASWVLEIAPTANLSTALAFAPRTVSAGITMANRRLFMSGPNVSGAPIMEYGNPALVNISSTETVTGSCTSVANGSVTITATGAIAPYSYSLNGGAFQASNTFNGLPAGVHTITIRDNACGTLTKTITVATRPSPAVSAGPDVTIVDGDEATLVATSSSSNGTNSWTPSGSIVSGGNTLTPVVKPNVSTTYTFRFQDSNGCVATDDAFVTVIPYCIKVMDAFTPNGDGMNDRWLVTNGAPCTKKNAVTIFNRYGHVVYKSDDYKNDWDGTYNGKPVPDATYYYVVTLQLINGKSVYLKGDVTILR